MNPHDLKNLRSELWAFASFIYQFNPKRLEKFEDALYQGVDTPIDDAALIKISRIVRNANKKIIPIEERLRMEGEKSLKKPAQTQMKL